MDSKLLIFLGKGWQFPIAFREEDASLAMVSEIDDIEQSLFILLSTLPGERIAYPEYGCDLLQLVFEDFTLDNKTRAIQIIEDAILEFEPRVKTEQIEIEFNPFENTAYVQIIYWVPTVNSRHNMVYPIYFNEGTDLSAQELKMIA